MDNLIATNLTLPIIGIHHSPLSQKFGTPRQPNLVSIASTIKMLAPYDTKDAFMGIEKYSHLWVIWQFHHNKPQSNFRPQVRPPRLGGNDKMGVFATRSMYRPSGLGLSVVKLDKMICDDSGRGVCLHLTGADMVDGTPIIDIKPYLPYSDNIAATSPIDSPDTKRVVLSETAIKQSHELIQLDKLKPNDTAIIENLIAQDPRPAYRQAQINTVFVMRYGNIDVVFFMDNSATLVIDKLLSVL